VTTLFTLKKVTGKKKGTLKLFQDFNIRLLKNNLPVLVLFLVGNDRLFSCFINREYHVSEPVITTKTLTIWYIKNYTELQIKY